MNETLDSKQLNVFTMPSKTESQPGAARQLYLTLWSMCHAIRALKEQAGCRHFAKVGKCWHRLRLAKCFPRQV